MLLIGTPADSGGSHLTRLNDGLNLTLRTGPIPVTMNYVRIIQMR